jgi:Glycosyltransferase
MRVLHVYSGNLYGGIETMLVTMARCRDVCPDMEPHFALSFEGRLSEELNAAGVPVHLLGNVRVSRPATVMRARRALAKHLRQASFDVVICHAMWSQAIFGPVVREAGLPLVGWMHDATEGRHWLDRWARRTPPDLAICNSHYTASTVKKFYGDLRSQVIYCPVAFADFAGESAQRHAARAEFETPEEAVVIIQVSRMEAWKGHALHLEALAHLRELPDWICWMVGGAQRPAEISYHEELRALANRWGIKERVRFIGERADVPRLLYAADIFCQPNARPEPFGISFIEALSAGLPVVTTAIGGACEIIKDSCGMLVPPADAKALAAALRELIQNPAQRAALGIDGQERALELCAPARQIERLHAALSIVAHLEMVG